MDPETKFLAVWFERFIRNQDLVFRRICNTEINDDILTIDYKNKTKALIKIRGFSNSISDDIKDLKEKKIGLVLYNTNENFNILIKQWEDLTKILGLAIYFINPYSKQEKKWIIHPRTHAMVSDSESFVEGLKSMFESVDIISEEEVKKLTS